MLKSTVTQKLMRIDGHAHVFLNSLPMLENRRYTPNYNALASDYFHHLRSQNLDGGLLVQPSFLGTDNSHLLTVLNEAKLNQPDLLIKGVAVVDPSITITELLKLKESGITGIRLNCVSKPLPDFENTLWKTFLNKIEELAWHVEIQVEGCYLECALSNLLQTNSRVIIDHFGLPDNGSKFCSGFQKLLQNSSNEVCIKVSAPYRVFPQLQLAQAVKKCTELSEQLMNSVGPQRLIWGSDWPWTQHEKGQSYSSCFEWGKIWFNKHEFDCGNVPEWLMFPDSK